MSLLPPDEQEGLAARARSQTDAFSCWGGVIGPEMERERCSSWPKPTPSRLRPEPPRAPLRKPSYMPCDEVPHLKLPHLKLAPTRQISRGVESVTTCGEAGDSDVEEPDVDGVFFLDDIDNCQLEVHDSPGEGSAYGIGIFGLDEDEEPDFGPTRIVRAEDSHHADVEDTVVATGSKSPKNRARTFSSTAESTTVGASPVLMSVLTRMAAESFSGTGEAEQLT